MQKAEMVSRIFINNCGIIQITPSLTPQVAAVAKRLELAQEGIAARVSVGHGLGQLRLLHDPRYYDGYTAIFTDMPVYSESLQELARRFNNPREKAELVYGIGFSAGSLCCHIEVSRKYRSGKSLDFFDLPDMARQIVLN